MQNRSTAVMQRRIEPDDSLDYFPTPAWGTRALFSSYFYDGLFDKRVLEPACGEGHMAKVLKEGCNQVSASDIYDYGYGDVQDFLSFSSSYDWLITNPPFRLAKEFLLKGLEEADCGVALLLRLSFLETVNRYNDIFSSEPPSTVLVFSERLPMIKGRVDRKAGSATSYAWFIWDKSKYDEDDIFHIDRQTELRWISPCRKVLERDEDYGTTI